MTQQSKTSHLLKLIPIGGWIFIAVGIIWQLQNQIIYWMWVIDIFLSCVVHPLQLIISIPLGKKLNIPLHKVIIMTIIFGGTYWKPLKKLTKK